MKGLLNRLFKLLYIIFGGFFIFFMGWVLTIYVFTPFKLIYAAVYWLFSGEFIDISITNMLDQPAQYFSKLYESIFNEEL